MRPLTPRQAQIASGLLNGKSNKRIARDLGISQFTVKETLQVVYRKLNVTNRTQAALRIAIDADAGVPASPRP